MERLLVKQRRQRRGARNSDNKLFGDACEYDSLLDAYLAEDFAALYAMECERDGIDLDIG